MALTIHWYLKYYSCHNEFSNIEVSTYISNHGTHVLKSIVKKKNAWLQPIICRKCMSEHLRLVARAWNPFPSERESSSNTNTLQYCATTKCTPFLCSEYVYDSNPLTITLHTTLWIVCIFTNILWLFFAESQGRSTPCQSPIVCKKSSLILVTCQVNIEMNVLRLKKKKKHAEYFKWKEVL